MTAFRVNASPKRTRSTTHRLTSNSARISIALARHTSLRIVQSSEFFKRRRYSDCTYCRWAVANAAVVVVGVDIKLLDARARAIKIFLFPLRGSGASQMDPHSTLSQFNSRPPKAGPAAQKHKYMESQQQPKPSLDSFPKKSSAGSARKAAASAPSGVMRRPIATNSRIKQDDQYRKDMHLAFVNNALVQKAKGVREPFDELVSQFNTKNAPQPAQLRLWISALSHVVSRLERTHAPLVQAVVNLPWTTMDGATVKTYSVFIGTLLSARPEYLSLVLGKITHGFTYHSGLQALDANTPEGSSSPLTRRIIYDRLHYLLEHLLSIIPTLPSTLQPLLVRNFPHKRQNQAAQTTYIRNLLRISSYCPELSDKILSTIVDRAIQIDVEIQVELEELEEQTDQDQDVFELDPFEVVVGQEEDDSDSDSDDEEDDVADLSSDDGEVNEPDPVTDLKHIQEMVKKLDTILTLVFEHFGARRTSETDSDSPPSSDLPELPPLPPITPTRTPLVSPLDLPSPITLQPQLVLIPKPPPPSQHSQFNSLLAIFDRIILPTFKSRYTQFLVKQRLRSQERPRRRTSAASSAERALSTGTVQGALLASFCSPNWSQVAIDDDDEDEDDSDDGADAEDRYSSEGLDIPISRSGSRERAVLHPICALHVALCSRPAPPQSRGRGLSVRDVLPIAKLATGGEPAYHLAKHATLLVIAQRLFSQSTTASSAWWTLRATTIHQHLLDEPVPVSPNLIPSLDPLRTLYAEDPELSAHLELEIGLLQHTLAQDKVAGEYFVKAARASGMEYELTGAMGKRTKFQQTELSQLVLLAESQLTLADGDEAAVDQSKAEHNENIPETLALNDDTLLEQTAFTSSSSSAHARLSHLEPGAQPALHPLDQCILLSMCLNVKNTSPVHGLTAEQMSPYVARVISHPRNWSVHTMALLLRARLEANRTRTVERATLQLQALVEQMPTTDSTVAPPAIRLRFIHSLPLPAKWELEGELAGRFLSLGVMRSALEIYERLGMWEEVVRCYQALEQRDQGIRIVRDLLAGTKAEADVVLARGKAGTSDAHRVRMDKAREAKLWCLLGDLEPDSAVAHYSKAWDLSNHTAGRAMRSLGGYHFARGAYAEAITCLTEAVKINPLLSRSWFILGCACMRVEDWEEARKAFVRCVTIDEEDGESWSNLASMYMRLGVADDQASPFFAVPFENRLLAFRALKQGLRSAYENWRMWFNYMIVSVDVGELAEAARAMGRVVSMHGAEGLDIDVLERLVDAVTRAEDSGPEEANAEPNQGRALFRPVMHLLEDVVLPKEGEWKYEVSSDLGEILIWPKSNGAETPLYILGRSIALHQKFPCVWANREAFLSGLKSMLCISRSTAHNAAVAERAQMVRDGICVIGPLSPPWTVVNAATPALKRRILALTFVLDVTNRLATNEWSEMATPPGDLR
ncbi:hypothetical protein HMN09_01269000 [Mycena chlorophos]|uniref:TPR-like protein n=1 Tax=Mycena chlorophos TaxID=658473 RepID=A0A8H6S406_MYCCL|nr:hypothetical protein HMN09_01269000 [Mycena chlorophos]